MNDFEETSALNNDTLNELLEKGDARERVLAIWALALRTTAAITMADQLRGEPDPGVRRALAVVLAGNGEIDLLVAMSRHDPNVHVRASAVQMVVRFAAAGRVPWGLVAARLADVAEVRSAVISQLDATSPPELQASAIGCLRDVDELVRREAFETCAKLVTAGALAPEVLREALEGAGEGECMNALAAWFALERAEVIGLALMSAGREIRERALRMHPELVLSNLAPLLGDDAELYKRLEYPLRLRLADSSFALLLNLALKDPWRVDIMAEIVTRLVPREHVLGEHLQLLRDVARGCEEDFANNVSILASEDELALYEDETGENEDALQERQRVLAALTAQVTRLGSSE